MEAGKFGLIVGLYLWVAGAPFGFVHPDEDNWLFFWRLLPISRLPILVGLSVVGASAIFLALLALRRETGSGAAEETARVCGRVLSPLYFLLIGLIQLVPGAMAALPVLPFVNKFLLPTAVFSSVVFLFFIEAKLIPAALFRNLDASLSSHKWRWSVGLFVVSLLVYGVFMKRLDMAFGYTAGDEAHYLVQAQSLAEDFDRDLVNQLPDYRYLQEYYLAKHLSAKSPPGKAYSYHSIGLPVLLAPGWAVGKVKGAMGVLVGISSLFAVSFFWIAFGLRQRSEFALGCWAVFCFTTPIVFYACRAYPELPSALIVLLVVWRMMRPEALNRWGWLATGCLIGFLPWLHIPRLAIPTSLLSVWGIAWLFFRRKKESMALFVAPLFVSAVLLIVLNQGWYGHCWDEPPGLTGLEKLDPQAWTGGYRSRGTDLFSCMTGLLGVFMDRYKGLLVSSPGYFIPLVCVLIGLFSSKLRFWRELWFWVFLVVYLPALGRRGWYGGACFPGRFLVSVLPLLLFPFASFLSVRRDRFFRAMFAVLTAISVWMTVLVLMHPDRFYRGAENARWFSPAAQLIALFYPYVGTWRGVNQIEDPFGIVLFVLWVGGAIALLQWAKKKEMPWHRCFNMVIAAILALPIFSTAVRRITNQQPYKFSFLEPSERYSTLAGINRPSKTRIRVAAWGEISPQTLRKQLTLELPAGDQIIAAGEIQTDELTQQKVVVYDPAKHKPGYLSRTGRLKFFAGEYIARFWLSFEALGPEDSLIIDAQDMKSRRVVAYRRLTAADVPMGKEFAPVDLPFSVKRFSNLSLRVSVDARNPVRFLRFCVEPSCLEELLSAAEGLVRR